MDLNFAISGNIDPVAAYAAVVATLVAILEVFRWRRSGARLRVTVSPNMVVFPNLGGSDSEKTFVLVSVRNVGDAPTTIGSLGLYYYTSRYKKWRNRRERCMIVPDPGGHFGSNLPFVLRPGERWSGAVEQTDDLVDMARQGFLYAMLGHSMSDDELLVRISIPEESAD